MCFVSLSLTVFSDGAFGGLELSHLRVPKAERLNSG